MPPRISGYDINKLPAIYKGAVNTYLANGAVKKVGQVKSAVIKTRGNESPVHKSSFNPKDTEMVLSVRIEPEDPNQTTATHHIYPDGTGTMKMGGVRNFSTSTDSASAGRRQ